MSSSLPAVSLYTFLTNLLHTLNLHWVMIIGNFISLMEWGKLAPRKKQLAVLKILQSIEWVLDRNTLYG